jgi:hypothetical protein
MTAKSDAPVERRVALVIPDKPFPVSMHFNRFSIITVSTLRLLQFALVHGTRDVGLFTCSIDEQNIKRNEERITDYLGQVGKTPDETEEWLFVNPTQSLPDVKFIQAARSGDQAEITFYNFSLHALVDAGRTKKEATVFLDPIAKLSTTLNTQLQFFAQLFGGFAP